MSVTLKHVRLHGEEILTASEGVNKLCPYDLVLTDSALSLRERECSWCSLSIGPYRVTAAGEWLLSQVTPTASIVIKMLE